MQIQIEELRKDIDNLIEKLNKLSFGELVQNKGELKEQITKLEQFICDFQKLINLPRKSLELDLDDYPLRETHRDSIIKLLRQNNGYYTKEQICFAIASSKENIGHILRQLEIEGILVKKKDKLNNQKCLWRIAKK